MAVTVGIRQPTRKGIVAAFGEVSADVISYIVRVLVRRRLNLGELRSLRRTSRLAHRQNNLVDGLEVDKVLIFLAVTVNLIDVLHLGVRLKILCGNNVLLELLLVAGINVRPVI